MSDVGFYYELTGSGWAEGTLQIGDARVRLTASYLSDALGDLLRAVLAMGRGSERVRLSWIEEPAEHRWIITRENQQATVAVRRFEHWDNGIAPDAWGAVVFDATCRVEDLMLAVAQGTRQAYLAHGVDGYRELWGEHEFPLDALGELESLAIA
ncbi:hypothetical protein [uncultured Jatrophihabitans sp.]|uniref:hypothetical protein n=1 Tax=uncultured Jatrophihabitans sp. TaxID=1610747 RepID=UPI0035CB3A03